VPPILKTDREALQQSWNVHRLKTRLKTVTALLGRTEMQLELFVRALTVSTDGQIDSRGVAGNYSRRDFSHVH